MANGTEMQEAAVVEARPGVEVKETPTEGGGELPDAVLQIPAMQALMAGQPGAFSAVIEDFEKKPEGKILGENIEPLQNAGFGLYRSLDSQKGVLFNLFYVSPEEVQAADQSGQLETIAPPFDELNAAVAKSGAANPALAGGERPAGFRMGGSTLGAPMPVATGASAAPMPAGAQKTLASKRAANLQLGSPTSGSAPAQGRILNTLLKPII